MPKVELFRRARATVPPAQAARAARQSGHAALLKIRRVTELRYVEGFPAADKPGPARWAGKFYLKLGLRRVNFPLVGRSRSLLALATRLRHDRPDDDSRGSPEKSFFFLDSRD